MKKRAALTAAAAILAVLGCGSTGINQRLSTLEEEEQRRQKKLDALALEITSAEQRISFAKADAEYHSCLATRARIESDVAVFKAKCLLEVAERGACIAKNESRTTKGAGLGCLAGWLFAAGTGGAGAPAIAIGCGGGAVLSEATKRECGAPPPCNNIKQPEKIVLRQRGLVAMPQCSEPEPPSDPEPEPVPSTTTASRAGACERWQVEWLAFEAPPRQRDGQAWDPDGSGPDLVYTIVAGGGPLYRSDKVESVSLNEQPTHTILLSAGQKITIELADQDLVSLDRIAVFEFEVPTQAGTEPLALTNGRTTAKVKLSCSAGG